MGDPRRPRRPGSERWRCDADREEHRSRARRGAPGIRATRLGRGVRRPDAPPTRPAPSAPRTSSGWRSPRTCSGGPTSPHAVGARAHLEAVRDGRRRARDPRRRTRSGWSSCSGARWPRRAAGSRAAARLIEETGYDGVERGLLLIPQALQALDGRATRPTRSRSSSRSPPSPSGSTTRTSDARPARSRAVADRDERGQPRRRRCSTRR